MSKRKENYLTYLNSDHWKELRSKKLREIPRCIHCESPYRLNVHHVNYRHLTDCVSSDLEVLCEECHHDFHRALNIVGGKTEDYPYSRIRELITLFRTDLEFQNRPRKNKRIRGNRTRCPRSFHKKMRQIVRTFRGKSYTIENAILFRDELSSIIENHQTRLPSSP